VIIIVFFNHFEKTWIGKLFTLGQRSTTKAGYVSNDVLEDLAGKEGVAHTTLRPAGIAKINGNLVDVVTEGDFIDAGSPIVVLRVVGGRNIVRKRD
ncbi:MAG: NfeD family protein, partial [Veillonella sp.]|nr:NfeD family protein [Veillonella sp.]